MRVAVTGGTGLVGHFIVERLVAAGHEVTLLSRRAPAAGLPHREFALGTVPDLRGIDALVHAALDHEPDRYRGGEGADAPGFLSRNLGGTVALFAAAREAGFGRVVFLSTRAVYGAYPPGTSLTEEMPPRPDTLYGHVKREAEVVLARLSADDFVGTSLRVTGTYGPAPAGREHKWASLFREFAAGAEIAPRVGTEVHGEDVAAAVDLVLAEGQGGVLNVSDIVLDRADLLAEYARIAGVEGRVPGRADPASVSAMATGRLRSLGWRPRGRGGFGAALQAMCGAACGT